MGSETKTTKSLSVAAALAVCLLCFAATAEANPISGIFKIIGGVLQVPLSMLVGTFSGPPILGTAFGAVNGVIQGLGMVASGALELVSDGVGVAKTVGPYLIPIFL